MVDLIFNFYISHMEFSLFERLLIPQSLVWIFVFLERLMQTYISDMSDLDFFFGKIIDFIVNFCI